MNSYILSGILATVMTVCGLSSHGMPEQASQQAVVPVAADAVHGAEVFRNECGLCHQAAEGDGDGGQGPNLNGVVGRKIGGDKEFSYSQALTDSNDIWTKEKLQDFLEDPEKAFPGNYMPINVPSAKDRADLIAYLAALSPAR